MTHISIGLNNTFSKHIPANVSLKASMNLHITNEFMLISSIIMKVFNFLFFSMVAILDFVIFKTFPLNGFHGTFFLHIGVINEPEFIKKPFPSILLNHCMLITGLSLNVLLFIVFSPIILIFHCIK